MFLSIIIPCYNEEENIKRGVLKEVYDYLATKDFDWEVIVSDDGSSDESLALIKKQIRDLPHFSLLENPHGGKPSALFYGIKKAVGEYVLFTDMDQSTPISELDKLLGRIGKNVKIVIGSRGLVRKNFPLYRRLGAIIFSTVRRAMILPEITDTQCGFKLFARDVLSENFGKLEFFQSNKKAQGWTVTSWDIEFLHILKKKGYKITEVPVIWHDKDVGSKSKGFGLGKYMRESKEMFSQILRVKLNDLGGRYNQ